MNWGFHDSTFDIKWSSLWMSGAVSVCYLGFEGLIGLAVYNDVMVFISFLISLSTDALLVEVFSTGGPIN